MGLDDYLTDAEKNWYAGIDRATYPHFEFTPERLAELRHWNKWYRRLWRFVQRLWRRGR